MGITAGPSYTTEQGFVISPLYLSITNMRFNLLPGNTFQSIFTVQAYKSREDKHLGRAPISIPSHLQLAESFIQAKDFYRKSVFQLGYEAAKTRWAISGYLLEDVFEPGQPHGTQYIYDVSGFNVDGFNAAGYKEDGFNAAGFNAQGYDRDGYDAQGFNLEGYNRAGYDRDGFDRNGYNSFGFDRDGYNSAGFNSSGFDRDGYDVDGYNVNGVDRDGNLRPPPSAPEPQPEPEAP